MLGATHPFQVDAGAVSILRQRLAIGRGGRRRKEARLALDGYAARPRIATAAGRAFEPWDAASIAERKLGLDLRRISNRGERGPAQDLRAAPNG